MKRYLNTLIQGGTLTFEEALEALTMIATGNAGTAQAAAFLMGIQQKGITAVELRGFRQGMLNLAVDLHLEDAMDVCGTGGDGKDTFNISTTSAFIAAGAGVRIAKHGNHGVSSAVGSSTVLEHLGVKFTNDPDHLKRKLDEAGICYMHAPLFHPAMRYIAPVRKDLGVKTFFNILGPLMNPAKVQCQLTGVSDLKTFELYKELFSSQEGRYAVIHALDGYDEVSLTGGFRLWNQSADEIYHPAHLGLPEVQAEDLGGGNTLEDSANILIGILQGKGTEAQTSAVLANAGLAISTYKGISLEEGVGQARESLDSGRAYQSFLALIK
ncbi:anthranilate phosphoribosyltransferase [Leadbetterella byssophila DSM 17132]|uniref:Anthranilate phosphoribosyltransferase n=1 Tax=Leadbetterella byssophila (strain DSM 17132 / JCM 16389 / KACC 11308 / NBRC 106382 / 4M15) TaxID=649349 RepID=E4RYC0_LEAB4|nr:anthranilate phosphoribosyltransferase [Leadbetterella byssophila]ADQ18156.1 anthranilate phosphoribosyltransferase [Leadbetterella byssophila DSM 17132]